MTEFKEGDRVRFINDVERRMIGTVRAIHKGYFIVMVEWDDPDIVTYPYYDTILSVWRRIKMTEHQHTDTERLDWLATHRSEALDIFGRVREADYVRDYIDDHMIGDKDEQ